ncbi:hypothetical protein BaRGS_00031799 [Batillaria attramentaria]|uniref:F-box domain-containing protein n=1 Tax=Batillaria attramentaria TaxID=370345 RepID=A0ABD0JQI5_9CAEN
MARRKCEPLNTSPAAELDAKSSTSHQHTEPAVWRNHKGKSFYVNRSSRSRLQHVRVAAHPVLSPTVATRTRAQTKQKLQQSGARRVTRQQRHSEQHQSPCASSSTSPIIPTSPSPKGSTVAATTSRAAPVSGQGPATRSRSDRLRERVKVDTPDTSSNGADMDRHLEDVNGNASREGISGGDSIGLGGPSCSKPARQRIPSREHPPPKLQQWLDTFKLWSNAERMMALDDLIALCDPSQVRHMMHVIEPQFQRDFISLLPKELALYVLSFLEPRDLLRAAQTCRYWHILCEDNLLWREKCREEGIDETLVYGSRPRRRPGPRSPCKALFMRQSQIEHNWRTGTSRSPKILKGHDDHVITCLEFCGHRIVSGSDDNTLKVWSVLSGKCLRTLIGHTGGVWSSQMSGNIIISGSTDRTLKVWNADSGTCKHTLYGHTSTVRCMSLCGSKVVSGSRDATLRVWDIETGQCLHVLMGHVAAVRCVQYDGRRVVSGAYDYTVRVWDPETETCLHTLQGHSNRVYSLQFDGVHVVSGSLDTSIRVWDVETGACLHTLIGHQSLTSGLELKDNILVSGNADSTVKVWDITTGQCLQTLQGPNKHQSAVTCLQFSKKFVITSSDDGTVKIWDLKTGEFLRNLVSLESGGSGGVVWRLRCSNTKLVCAVGSRNGTEETKLMVLDFDVEDRKLT